eukprot:1140299-Pyramimonas_sp.AAC.1
MAVLQLMPNIITYHIRNSWCEKGGCWQRQQAMALLSEMVDVQLEPNINTCSALNSACEKIRRWRRQQTKALLSEMA